MLYVRHSNGQSTNPFLEKQRWHPLITVTVMASQIFDNSIASSTVCLDWKAKKVPRYCFLCEGIITWEALSCHDVIIYAGLLLQELR